MATDLPHTTAVSLYNSDRTKGLFLIVNEGMKEAYEAAVRDGTFNEQIRSLGTILTDATGKPASCATNPDTGLPSKEDMERIHALCPSLFGEELAAFALQADTATPPRSRDTRAFRKLYENETIQKLPVYNKAEGVVKSVLAGNVNILSASTGSGKTIITSAMLADASDDPVLVLVPRRFLAMNAAESIASLSGTKVGQDVGYAVGSRGSTSSTEVDEDGFQNNNVRYNENTRLVFATPDYAIASGMLEKAKVVVLDEVHEQGSSMTFAKMLLHNRKKAGEDIRVMEMSATMDVEAAKAYWEDVAPVNATETEGKAFKCEETTVSPKQKHLAEVALDLILEKQRKGILIFCPGKGEIESTIRHISDLARDAGITNLEIAGIHGGMDEFERKEAFSKPKKGNVKILVGTNVMESGMNIPWADAGISDGFTKIKQFRDSGAQALVLERLPQWRLTQQLGRTNRFQDSDFVLYSDTPRDQRPMRSIPEIQRIPLEPIVMRCYKYGLDPREQKFDAEIPIARLEKAMERVELLGLAKDGIPTAAGQLMDRLGVSAESAALLWEAKQRGVMEDGILMAAIMENESLRDNWRSSHKQNTTSDVLDSMQAYNAFRRDFNNREGTKSELFTTYNINPRIYDFVHKTVTDLRRRIDEKTLENSRPAKEEELEYLLLAASPDRLYHDKKSLATDFVYEEGKHSVLHKQVKREDFLVGGLREIQGKKETFAIIEPASRISKDVLFTFIKDHPEIFGEPRFSGKGSDAQVILSYLGKKELTFSIRQNSSPALTRLIEPAYSEYKQTQNILSLAASLGIAEEEARKADMTSYESSLLPLATKRLHDQGLDNLTLSLGDTPPASGMVRLGTHTVGYIGDAPSIHLDAPEGSLTAAQFKQLMQTFPEIVTFGNATEQSRRPHAYELADHSLTLHSTVSDATWKDTNGRPVQEIAALALKRGESVAVAEAAVVSTDRTSNLSWLSSNFNDYFSEAELSQARATVQSYKDTVQHHSLQQQTTGTLEVQSLSSDSLLVPFNHKAACDAASAEVSATYHSMCSNRTARESAFNALNTPLKQSNMVATLGENPTYEESLRVQDPKLLQQIQHSLMIREELERLMEKPDAIRMKYTRLNPNGETQIRFDVRDIGHEDGKKEIAALRAFAEKHHIPLQENQQNWSYGNITLTIAPSLLPLPENAPTPTPEAITTMLINHAARMQAIEANREDFIAARQVQQAEKLGTELLPKLQELHDMGGAIPQDLRSHIDTYSSTPTLTKTTGNTDVDALLLQMAGSDADSHPTADQALQRHEVLAQMEVLEHHQAPLPKELADRTATGEFDDDRTLGRRISQLQRENLVTETSLADVITGLSNGSFDPIKEKQIAADSQIDPLFQQLFTLDEAKLGLPRDYERSDWWSLPLSPDVREQMLELENVLSKRPPTYRSMEDSVREAEGITANNPLAGQFAKLQGHVQTQESESTPATTQVNNVPSAEKQAVFDAWTEIQQQKSQNLSLADQPLVNMEAVERIGRTEFKPGQLERYEAHNTAVKDAMHERDRTALAEEFAALDVQSLNEDAVQSLWQRAETLTVAVPDAVIDHAINLGLEETVEAMLTHNDRATPLKQEQPPLSDPDTSITDPKPSGKVTHIPSTSASMYNTQGKR
jgi:HrpA-like RNA helicase